MFKTSALNRQPLRSIVGFGEILLEEHTSGLAQEGLEHLNRIVRSAKIMGQLIDGLLDLSRLARLDLHAEVVDLSSVARGLIAGMLEIDPERNIKCAISDGMKGYGDPRLLRSALGNLLSNAWKYTSKSPEARIEFGTAPAQEDNAPVYYIRDNGAGFDMAYSAKLFGAFQRLHSSSDYDGTGIGLASVQRIIHRHGGRVWAEGKVGEGATFYFTLGALDAEKYSKKAEE